MLAEPETTARTDFDVAVAAPVDPTVAAVRALRQVERAQEADGAADAPTAIEADRSAAAAYTPSERVARVQAAQIEGAETIAARCRSEALRRIILEAVRLKKIENAKAHEHNVGGRIVAALRGTDAHAAAEVEEADRERGWLEAWEAVKAAAEAILTAPADGDQDLLDRTDAYLFLMSDSVENGRPVAYEEYEATALASLRSAIQRRIEEAPDRSAFDAAAAAYRTTEAQLSRANDDLEHLEGVVQKGGEVDPGVVADQNALVDRLYAERDQVADRLLALTPPDLDGLLLLMEVVCDRGHQINVSTYAGRNHERFAGPVTVEALSGEDGGVKGLAFIARHLAEMRDRQMPEDWRKLMSPAGGLRGMHPNAADVIRRAYDSGLDPADLANVQLTGLPEHDLPKLAFSDGSRTVHVTPLATYDWVSVR